MIVHLSFQRTYSRKSVVRVWCDWGFKPEVDELPPNQNVNVPVYFAGPRAEGFTVVKYRAQMARLAARMQPSVTHMLSFLVFGRLKDQEGLGIRDVRMN